jgi:hypothetical protein
MKQHVRYDYNAVFYLVLARQGGPSLFEWARSVFPHWNIKDDSYDGLIRILVLPKKDV